jgi:Spy/CpxP family protein refolding chaperone
MKAGKLLLVLAATGSLAFGTFALGVKAADNSTDFSSIAATQRSDHPLVNFIRGQIGRWMVLRSELDLTADQKQQIAAIVQAHKAEILQVVRPVVQKRQALRDAVTAANPDETVIRSAADDLGHAIGDAAVLASKIKQQVAPILTDEQRRQITDFRRQSDHAVEDFFSKMAASVN